MMPSEYWKSGVMREYYQVDMEFVSEVLPIGSVDSSSFGLIADATDYVLVGEGDDVRIKPYIAELQGILRSIGQSGMRVSPEDAWKSVQRFAEMWERQIKDMGKWEEMVERAQAAGEIRRPGEVRVGMEGDAGDKGLLGRLKKWLFGQ